MLSKYTLCTASPRHICIYSEGKEIGRYESNADGLIRSMKRFQCLQEIEAQEQEEAAKAPIVILKAPLDLLMGCPDMDTYHAKVREMVALITEQDLVFSAIASALAGEAIETALMKHPLIEQIFQLQNDLESCRDALRIASDRLQRAGDLLNAKERV